MPMKDSNKSDAWIAKAVAANPIRIAENGNILTCPVRLHYVNIFEPAKLGPKDAPDKVRKYGVTALFPLGVEAGINSIIKTAVFNAARAAFPGQFAPETGEPSGLHFPMRAQAEKPDLPGFTRGGLYFNATSKFQPRIVDTSGVDVVVPSRAYNGVWALLALNPYTFNDPRKKGVSLGLQMVMLFADDTRLISAKADPKKVFAGVNIDSSFDVDKGFGEGPPADTASKAENGGLW